MIERTITPGVNIATVARILDCDRRTIARRIDRLNVPVSITPGRSDRLVDPKVIPMLRHDLRQRPRRKETAAA